MNEIAPRPSAVMLTDPLGARGSVLFDFVTETTELIPRSELPTLRRVLDDLLVPATSKEIDGAIALIAAAWPHAHQRAEPEVIALHLRQLREDLADYPPAILQETVRRLRRTLKWIPSIAELRETADDLLAVRQIQRRAVDCHEREHRRRTAEESAMAEREGAKRREDEAEIAQLAENYGAPFPCTVEEWRAACGAFYRAAGLPALRRFRSALDRRECWPGAVFPLLLLADRVAELMRQRVVDQKQAAQIIAVGGADLEQASRILAMIEAGDLPEQLREDDSVTWDHPSRVLADLIARIEQSVLPGDAR